MNSKKLIKMVRIWQQREAVRRKRIALGRSPMSPAPERGCFVVYTADRRRFAFPISYLSSHMFQELLRLSEDEFGPASDGPITLPCDSVFLEYLISMIQRRLDTETEKALLMSISTQRCSLHCSLHQEQSCHQ